MSVGRARRRHRAIVSADLGYIGGRLLSAVRVESSVFEVPAVCAELFAVFGGRASADRALTRAGDYR